MTKSQAFSHADPIVIAQMFATNASDITLAPLKRFLKRNNKLQRPVICMMVLYIIAALDHKLPNQESYYRKTQEDWLDRNILTPEAALSYYAEAMEIARANRSQNISAAEATKPVTPFKPIAIDQNISDALDKVYNNIK